MVVLTANNFHVIMLYQTIGKQMADPRKCTKMYLAKINKFTSIVIDIDVNIYVDIKYYHII